MTKKISDILNFLNILYPNVGCELNYSKDYELAIAVMLSAQTTDASVNRVTPILFSKYKSVEELAKAEPQEIENIIHTLGLSHNKSINVSLFSEKLFNEFNSILPRDKDILITFPGIGNKSAGVIRAEVFKIPDLPVDTHILRISNRLGLTESQNPDVVEKDLKNQINEDLWIKTHHQFIHFGRYYCTAKNPHCEDCQLKKYCKNK